MLLGCWLMRKFQHTAARRRLPRRHVQHLCHHARFNTQPPEGGCPGAPKPRRTWPVSTHSRPKAAAAELTQADLPVAMFQHTAARRRLLPTQVVGIPVRQVSTHSRPKAAACAAQSSASRLVAFQHTAARRRLLDQRDAVDVRVVVSTHSRPKAAASIAAAFPALWRFQHTAARRRLPGKRAGQRRAGRFNTQPPEGGCYVSACRQNGTPRTFQHTAARRRLPAWASQNARPPRFNTQPPEGGCL